MRKMVREIFGRFQNLNLLSLIHGLRDGDVDHGSWSDCPVGYGLSYFAKRVLFQEHRNFCIPAREIGCGGKYVSQFVDSWDKWDKRDKWEWKWDKSRSIKLLTELEDIWQERLEDALAVQEFIGEANESHKCFEGDENATSMISSYN